MFVSAEKFKQRLHAFFVPKHNWREVTVEELNPISNGWWPSWARKCSIERFKIELKKIISIGSDEKGWDFKHPSREVYTHKICTKGFTYCPLTSSSLKRRYTETVKWSTLSSYTFTRTYSLTPGLGRIASATNGGKTMASWMRKLQLINKSRYINTA